MKIQYANEFVQNLGISDTKTYVYKLMYDEKGTDDTNIIQYVIMHVLVLCIKVDSYVAHMFYT